MPATTALPSLGITHETIRNNYVKLPTTTQRASANPSFSVDAGEMLNRAIAAALKQGYDLAATFHIVADMINHLTTNLAELFREHHASPDQIAIAFQRFKGEQQWHRLSRISTVNSGIRQTTRVSRDR